MTKKYKRFCINCGTTGLNKEDLIEGLCFNCYKLKYPLLKLKEQPTLNICKECLALRINKHWVKTDTFTFYEHANHMLTKNITNFFETAENSSVSVSFTEFPDFYDLFKYNTIQYEVNVEKQINDELSIKDSKEYKARIKISICENCKDFKTNISKSKIRIIAKKRKILDNEIDEILEIFKNNAEIYKDPNLYILPPVLSKNELIFRMSSIDFAKNIAHQIVNRLGGVIRESIKFMDREKSKSKKQDLNILIRLLPFFTRDVIKYNNKLLYVISIQDNHVNIFDFENNEIKKFKTKEIIKGEKYLDHSKFEKFSINAIYKNTIQIMNLKTFQTFEIEMNENPHLKNIKEGMEINGFKEGEKLHLIPFI